MLVAGVALPFNHCLYRPVSEWSKVHAWVQGGEDDRPGLSQETPDVLEQHMRRIDIAGGVIRHRLKEARPEVIVALVTDHGRMFSGVQVPQIFTLAAEEIWGSTRLAEFGEPAADEIIRFKGDPALATFIQEELVFHKFDTAFSLTMRPMGQPDYGADQSLTTAIRTISPNLDIPVVPIFINTQLKPAPNGQRSHDFGRTLGAILDESPRRIALVASGGMSHDHHGRRVGFVDDLMDEWVLKTLERGLSERMAPMFSQESDQSHGGTAELRLWMAAAAACESVGAKGLPVDYIMSRTAAAGMGFMYWPISAAAAR